MDPTAVHYGDDVRGGIDGLRWLLAPNPSPLTLTGTRTYVVGVATVAVIDPGPASPEHIDALVELIDGAFVTGILVTHDHPDHAAGAPVLANRLRAPVLAAAAGTLETGDRIGTDTGDLVAVPTPGHTPDHFALHWPVERAVFCGDLLMGGLATTLVAAPDGDLGDYLASLERVRALEPSVVYPAHGPPFPDPAATLAAYGRHRIARQREVLAALGRGPADVSALVDAVYGSTLNPALRRAAEGALVAYLEYLEARGAVRRERGGAWSRTDPNYA